MSNKQLKRSKLCDLIEMINALKQLDSLSGIRVTVVNGFGFTAGGIDQSL